MERYFLKVDKSVLTIVCGGGRCGVIYNVLGGAYIIIHLCSHCSFTFMAGLTFHKVDNNREQKGSCLECVLGWG